MDAATLDLISKILTIAFLILCSLAVCGWTLVTVESFITTHREDKRDREYHELRMSKHKK